MLDVRILNNKIQIGRHFSVSFQRTLRIPDDGKVYPLPPGLGRFPILKVADFQDRVPASWREHGGVFIPMYQRESLWLYFNGAYWRSNAVKVGIGKINALSAKTWSQTLAAEDQDYMVVPDQPWIDGINAGNGYIRQFVAMPLGMGYTVEGQLTGKEEFGGIQMIVYDPRPGRFPETEPRGLAEGSEICYCLRSAEPSGEMGLGAGGRMKQKINPDQYGIETWDPTNYGRVFVHIVNSMMYREITGKEAPATPVTANEYSEHGLPWFDLYDEAKGDIAPAGGFGQVKSVKEMDKSKGFGPQQDDRTLKGLPVVKLPKGVEKVDDGEW